MPLKGARKKWYWSCGWGNGKVFHADAEYCTAQGQPKYDTKQEALAAGRRHAQSHGGYEGDRYSHGVYAFTTWVIPKRQKKRSE